MMLLPKGHRRLVQVIPDPVQEWWDKWELRGLILVSLVSQIILTLFGNRTKYKPNIWTRALVWSAYLLADWVATVAMGVISSNLGDYYNNDCQQKIVNPQLLAFWAPFFLIHLGGPDTITAYALEDNELWLRHLVGLYGERTWSLYCGSIKHLRHSFLRSIEHSRKSEVLQHPCRRDYERDFLRFIYIFVSLFADLVLSPRNISRDRHGFQNKVGWGYAFNKVVGELKLIYDVFYTKAFANYGFGVLMSRLITLTATSIVLGLYAKLSENKEHLVMDRIITILLLSGALISEMYALTLALSSEWRK
ncbi:hypothetical protein E2542_SST13173 [Spatholobus suberectus]|nr:hypothetical protein E2542_SST13173 [Spatholobus suberectus]